uniref:Estrogen receptor binding site associated antigen 9 n=2 Tax=Oryzias latipes TaxID=8090 RepID=H2N2E1_ORYLA
MQQQTKTKNPIVFLSHQITFIMAITQFRLFKICTCLASILSFLKRLICRSGRGRKLSGDQITLPTTVDFSSSLQKQPEIEDWSSWDEDAPTSIKIEGGNGTISPPPNEEEEEPDYFKDMAPTIRKTQKIVLKKREPMNYQAPDGSAGFSSRLAASQDMMAFSPPSAELGEMETWQEDANAWEDESNAVWEAEDVLRQQKLAEREKRFMEQQRKKLEKEAQRMLKKEQKIAVKLS